jgi:hypothetical protein
MMRSEAITIIKRGLGFRQTQDAAIIAALKQAQRDAELGQTLPNWLLVFNQAQPMISPISTYTLPTRFIRFHEEYPVRYTLESDPSTPIFLPKWNYLEAVTAYGARGVDLGPPQVFVQMNKTELLLIPSPDVNGTLFITSYIGEPVLDSDIENKWLLYAPNYIVGMAGVHVAGDLRDRAAAEKFNLMARIGQKALLGDIVEDELAGRPLIMGRNN